MLRAVYMSEADPWWTLEKQEEVLANAMAGAKPYVDRMDRQERQGHSAARFAQRQLLVRTTTRSVPLTITVASLAVLAWSENDLAAFLDAVIARGAVLVSLEDGTVFGAGGDAKAVIAAWAAAKAVTRQEAGQKRGGQVTKERKEAETLPKVEKYKHLWGHPGYSQNEVLVMMGVSRNTAAKYLKATWRQAAFANRDLFARQIRTASRRKAREPS